MCSKWGICLLLIVFASHVGGYNILGLFPHPGKSHYDVFQPLMAELASRGHNVTVVSHFPLNKPEVYADVSLEGTAPLLLNALDMSLLENQTRLFKYLGAVPLISFAEQSCESLATPQMQNLLNSDLKYDLIIIEMFTTDCYLGVVHKFNAPFIGLSSSVVMPWMNDRFGNIDNPAYVPVMFMDFSDRMSFFQRVENSLMLLLNKFIHKVLFNIPGHEAAKKYISADIPPLEEIAKKASLFLVNAHFSLNRPRPLVPNVVEVGGMHLKKPGKLPSNLEKFINESPHGVIYFSMGSMIKAHTFPDQKRDAFLGAFKNLKQRVLWKWENDTIPNKPKNLMIQPWMPQYDILCHSNVVAFISHGGLLGTTEAVQCGVPIIVMPQYGDQFTNAEAVQAVGAGVVLNFEDVTVESVSKALDVVLQPSFKKQAEAVSARFRDRPMSPMDTAVYWVEYVARHGGAHHMRSAAVDLPFYQYLLLDVIAFIALVLAAAAYVTYLISRTVWRLLCGTKRKQKTQ